MALIRMRESLCMSPEYITDITDTASKSIRESVERLNAKSRILEFKQDNHKIENILRESNVENDIVKKVIDKLHNEGVETSKHKIYRLPVARFGNLNGNHRRYPEELWVNVMNNQENSWKYLQGLCDHPVDDNDPGSFKDSAIVWLGMEIDRPNKLVYGIGSFVGPYGHLAQEIIDCGGKVGFSSSGFGELMSDGETVNPDTYQIERLADVVLNPSQSVYGVISDEANNIEYNKQTVKESLSSTPNNLNENLQESTQMEKATAVNSAFNKVQEKELRKHIKNYLKENKEIVNPYQQKKDLQEILSLVQEGQLSDLEEEVKAKLEEAERHIEEAVEKAVSMKESEISVETTDGTVVTVKPDAPETPSISIEQPVMETPVVEEPVVEEEPTITEEPVVESDELLMESRKLSKSEEKALRNYIMNFLNESHDSENPLEVLAHLDEALNVVKGGQLSDLEPSVIKALEEQKAKIQKDIVDAQKMKEELGSKDISEITSTTKKIMETGSILAEQVSDYKALCEALTQRNQALTKEFTAIKAKLELKEAQEEKKTLERNQKLVSSEAAYKELNEKFEDYKKSMSTKVDTYRETAARFSKGNSDLEKKNGVIATRYKAIKESLDKAIAEKDNLSKKYESQLSELKASYEKKLQNGKDAYKSLKEAFNELSSDIENNDSMAEKYANMSEAYQNLKNKFQSYRETAKNKFAELKEELATMKEDSESKIKGLNSKLNKANKALKESEEANEEVDVLYDRINSLEDRLSDANGIIDELRNELSRLKDKAVEESEFEAIAKEVEPTEESTLDVSSEQIPEVDLGIDESDIPSTEESVEEPTNDTIEEVVDSVELPVEETVAESAETEPVIEEVGTEESEVPSEESEDISLSDSMKELDATEDYWNELFNKYGEALMPYEQELRYASSYREAQINWLGIMSKIDENMKTVDAITFNEATTKESRIKALNSNGFNTSNEQPDTTFTDFLNA